MPDPSLTGARGTGLGSLVVCGEYAVLEPGGLGIVSALDASVHADVFPADTWRLETPFRSESFDPVRVEAHGVDISPASEQRFARSAVVECAAYLLRMGKPIDPLRIVVGRFSPSANADPLPPGVSGLSSSAAVVAAIVSGMLRLYMDADEARRRAFPLALRAHRRAQGGVGSGIDVAAALFGGFELFTAHPQSPSVRPLRWPSAIRVRIMWSGERAETAPRIERLGAYRRSRPQEWSAFVRRSTELTTALLDALSREDVQTVFSCIEAHRLLLSTLGAAAGLEIETPVVKRMIALGDELGMKAKASGAGGGDCGLLFFDETLSPEAVDEAMEEAGLTPLRLGLGIEVDSIALGQ